ncbi:unnamed protein product, partial [Scytosiphon promiscuus]
LGRRIRCRHRDQRATSHHTCHRCALAKPAQPSGHEQGDEKVQRQQYGSKGQQRPCKAQRPGLGIAQQTSRNWPVRDQLRPLAGTRIQGARSGWPTIEPRWVSFRRFGRCKIGGLQG